MTPLDQDPYREQNTLGLRDKKTAASHQGLGNFASIRCWLFYPVTHESAKA